jgi:hypothetical protein
LVITLRRSQQGEDLLDPGQRLPVRLAVLGEDLVMPGKSLALLRLRFTQGVQRVRDASVRCLDLARIAVSEAGEGLGALCPGADLGELGFYPVDPGTKVINLAHASAPCPGSPAQCGSKLGAPSAKAAGASRLGAAASGYPADRHPTSRAALEDVHEQHSRGDREAGPRRP